MLAIYEAADRIEARILIDMLETHRIKTFMQGDYLAGAAGDLPTIQFPSIWVLDDRDAASAKSLIKKYFEQSDQSGPDWRCVACGEQLESSFQQCWQCGEFRPVS